MTTAAPPTPPPSSSPDALAALRERWSALPAEPAPSREPPPPALTAAHGATSVAVRPLTSTAPAPEPISVVKPPLPKPRPSKHEQAAPQQDSLLVPLWIAGVAALVLGVVLGGLQTLTWVLVVFELAVGFMVALSLTPLRRHRACTRDTLNVATIAFVGATYFVYLVAACVFAGVNPYEFFDGTTFGRFMRRGAELGFGFGLALFFGKVALSWFAARRFLRYLGDETLDRF